MGSEADQSMTLYNYGWWTKLNKSTVGCSFCVRFSKSVLREGLAKELPEMKKQTTCLKFRDCTMVLPIFTCKVDATTKTAFNHIPDLFWEGPGAGEYSDPEPETWV